MTLIMTDKKVKKVAQIAKKWAKCRLNDGFDLFREFTNAQNEQNGRKDEKKRERISAEGINVEFKQI